MKERLEPRANDADEETHIWFFRFFAMNMFVEIHFQFCQPESRICSGSAYREGSIITMKIDLSERRLLQLKLTRY
jgi:hypothetical protein